MPWMEVEPMEEKKKFVFLAWQRKESFTALCRKYGISTKTGYKWLNRYLKDGIAGLEEESRAPKNNGNGLPVEIETKLMKLKRKHPVWGAFKILHLYEREYPDAYAPCLSTVHLLFKREGLTKKQKRRRKAQNQRIQARIKADKPNKVWTVDFKGWWWTAEKERCEPLTVRDEFSKYVLAIETPEKGNTPHVKAIFEGLFREYGLPEYIRSDNGPPFASAQNLWGLSKLSVWWMSLGIKLDRDDPGCPYQNGGHERMHRDMMVELEGKIDGDLRKHQKVFDKWRKEFNTVRPHEALGGNTPAEVYKKSERKYLSGDVEIEYGGRMKSRQVNDRGVTHYKGRAIFVGNPFAGFNVGLKDRKDGRIEVWFDYFKLGELNPLSGQIEPDNVIIKRESA